MDEYASNMLENESKKNIYTFASMNFKCDSKGLYHRLKKINQNKNIPFKLRACFMNWFYKTPNAVMKHKINIKSKTVMVNPKLDNNEQELLIKTK